MRWTRCSTGSPPDRADYRTLINASGQPGGGTLIIPTRRANAAPATRLAHEFSRTAVFVRNVPPGETTSFNHRADD
jgi:hypothetical protein